jgi:hypothetical protein
MSDRRDFRKGAKLPASAKTNIDSSHKKTATKGKIQDELRPQRRNLMAEFERVERETNKK